MRRLTASKGIFESLLKAEKLENREVDGRMETKTALVRSQGRVELDSVAAVHSHVALVVLPDNAELDDTLGNGDDIEGGAVVRVLFEERALLKGDDEF